MIIGKTTVLLPFDEKYLELVRCWVNQPAVRAGTGAEGPASDYQHRRWYQNLMRDPNRRTYIIGEGVDKEATPVGIIGLKDLTMRSRSAEYWIYIGDAEHRRRGLAREATSLLLNFGFNTLGLHRVYLSVIENNAPALGLYRSSGFVQEGVAREQHFADGRFLDMIRFSLLEHEFRSSRDLGSE